MKYVEIILLVLISLSSCRQHLQNNRKSTLGHDSDKLINSSNIQPIKSTSFDSIKDNIQVPKEKEIAHSWQLIKGWFPDENLCFISSKKTTGAWIFDFRKNGSIGYVVKFSGFCNVGSFTMKDGKWTKKGQNLILELRGLKISDYWYWWKIQYKIKKLTLDTLKLQVIKVIKNKEIDPTLKWKDLIKEKTN